MKKRKFKIIEVHAGLDEKGNASVVTFDTKAGPFRYFLSNWKVRQRFLELNPKLLPHCNDPHLDLHKCVGRFLFVPERKGG